MQVLIFICAPSGASYCILKKKSLLATVVLMEITDKQPISKYTLSSLIHFLHVKVCSSIADGYQGNEAECKLVVNVCEVWEVTLSSTKFIQVFHTETNRSWSYK